MKIKSTLKIITDMLMTLLLLFLTGYQLWGDIAHEWAGTVMFVLFIAHHLLNFNWHKNLFKGKYNARRTVILCIDILIFSDMLIMMYSGIIMSRHVFSFLPISGGTMLARRLHILGSYWGYLLMSMHLGIHIKMFVNMIKKRVKIPAAVVFIPNLFIAAYDVYAFIKRDFLTYMFLHSEYVFLDYNESKILFYIDSVSIMIMCILIGYCLSSFINKK